MDIQFDVSKLNKRDRAVYEAMTEAEKTSFEKTWMLLEEQKARLAQKVNASRERAARDKKSLAVKERKERTHRLIERGAILEAYIREPKEFTNEEIKEIISAVFKDQGVKAFVEKIRERHQNTTI